MSKAEKKRYKAGKRDSASDSEYSYRSDVSAGGTRHVKRRRKREDGTYSAEESYHSSQDVEGEARRRRRRREREHEDSDHSYYSVISEGGTRHVRRRRRHADGTYSQSESYKSSSSADDSDVSFASAVSAGGTRRQIQRKRIRDAAGNVIGYGEAKPVKNSGETFSDSQSEYVQRGSVTGSESERGFPLRFRDSLKREQTTDSLKQGRDEAESILGTNWPGEDAMSLEQKLLAEDENMVPSDFSDITSDEEVDLSKMTPAQRRQYIAQREKRRQERERRRREKYGDKYDEIMKRRNAKKLESITGEQDDKDSEKDRLSVPDRDRKLSMSRRSSSFGNKPKSMVTYEKGPPRDTGYEKEMDNRKIGLAHEDWGQKKDDAKFRRKRSFDGDGDGFPRMHREPTIMRTPLPTIPQGRLYEGEGGDKTSGGMTSRSRSKRSAVSGDFVISKERDEATEETKPQASIEKDKSNEYFELGEDGSLTLKKKNIDLANITADQLRALGIDPKLSAKQIAKKLKAMFGKDLVITEGGRVVGTKGIEEFGPNVTEAELAKQEDLDLDTLSGLKRVNLIMRRGGSALRRHLQNVINFSQLSRDHFAKDIDERDADIDFLSHYRLVDPTKIEGYARAFVVEDADLDSVINNQETKVALDGVPNIQHMTHKQVEYVLKVLHIDEASLVTFRMFAVITALCERVTNMDSLSQHLLELCNLADIERKLDLYKAMFYHNVSSDRDSNFITSESLKIELIAGGLNWKQQQYIMEKMEPNDWGEISFLDYMCYIPLFLSLHDNICDNPLDMSNQKYQMPPRKRPASTQRDMNPLGYPLKKQTAYMIRKQAMEGMQGKSNNALQMSKRYIDMLKRFKGQRFGKFDDKTPKDDASSTTSGATIDLIY